MPKCSDPECTGDLYAKDLCFRHYRMVRRGTYECGDGETWQSIYYPADPSLLPDDGIIDETAVDITVKGIRTVRLNRQERRLAARRILADGGSVETISEHLGITEWLARDLVIRVAGNEPFPHDGGPIQEKEKAA